MSLFSLMWKQGKRWYTIHKLMSKPRHSPRLAFLKSSIAFHANADYNISMKEVIAWPYASSPSASFPKSLPPWTISITKGSPRPTLSERSFFKVERTALKYCTHYSCKAEAYHSYSDKHILNARSLLSWAIEFIGAARIDKKLYCFSYLSLRLCCSDKCFRSLLDTVNRIFINWKPRFQPHLSAGWRNREKEVSLNQCPNGGECAKWKADDPFHKTSCFRNFMRFLCQRGNSRRPFDAMVCGCR